MSRSVQWLNENSYRAYPFVEDSNMTAGSLTIPTSAILDFSLVNYTLSATPVRLLSLEITATPVPEGIFTFGYVYGPTFSFSVPATATLPFTAMLAVGGLHTITCVFGAGIPDLLTNPAGVYTLQTPAKIEPALLVFQGGRRLKSLAGSMLGSTPVAGFVRFAEGYNCSISINDANNTIVISAAAGAGAGRYCGTFEILQPTCSDVLLSINGMHADDNGNFELLGGDGVTIIPEKGSALVRIVGAKTVKDLECG